MTLEGAPGRLVPPIEMLGAKGWRTGYVVPVMSGALSGSIAVTPSGARGADASRSTAPAITTTTGDSGKACRGSGARRSTRACRWSTGACFRRPTPPTASGCPASSACSGPTARSALPPTCGSTRPTRPTAGRRAITVRALGTGVDLTLRFDVASAVTTKMAQGPLANDVNFLQLQGRYTVSGRAAGQHARLHRPRRGRDVPRGEVAPRRV